MAQVILVWRKGNYLPKGESDGTLWLCHKKRLTDDGRVAPDRALACACRTEGIWVVFQGGHRVCRKALLDASRTIAPKENLVLAASKEVARQLRKQGLKVTIKRKRSK